MDKVSNGSGYADYTDPTLSTVAQHVVPVVAATPENFAPFGHFVRDYALEAVIIKPFPVNGWRPLMGNTGIGGGFSEGQFRYWYEKNTLRAVNEAVGGDYITGVHYENTDSPVPPYLLTREANYHPDGGQVFMPLSPFPFLLLLAPPGDDVRPEDFVAFRFEGDCGVQIKPDIWHQPVYPLVRQATFMTKQGRVHACVGLDTIQEFGCWLRIAL